MLSNIFCSWSNEDKTFFGEEGWKCYPSPQFLKKVCCQSIFTFLKETAVRGWHLQILWKCTLFFRTPDFSCLFSDCLHYQGHKGFHFFSSVLLTAWSCRLRSCTHSKSLPFYSQCQSLDPTVSGLSCISPVRVSVSVPTWSYVALQLWPRHPSSSISALLTSCSGVSSKLLLLIIVISQLTQKQKFPVS